MTRDAPSPLPLAAFPRTTGEFIPVVSPFHRAEIARMAGRRDRIDRTTDWAIAVVAATLSVALVCAEPRDRDRGPMGGDAHV